MDECEICNSHNIMHTYVVDKDNGTRYIEHLCLDCGYRWITEKENIEDE